MSGEQKKISTGRGGAGNYRNSLPKDSASVPSPTPKLKGDMIPTGRGGSGNIVQNTDPELTRKLQDVNPVLRRDSDSASTGRGGAGNFMKNTPRPHVPESAIDDAPAPENGDHHGRTGSRGLLDRMKGQLKA